MQIQSCPACRCPWAAAEAHGNPVWCFPLQCGHENRLVERQLAEGAPATPDPVAGRRAAGHRGAAGNQAGRREIPRRRVGCGRLPGGVFGPEDRSEEHTTELQSLMRISYAVLCLK